MVEGKIDTARQMGEITRMENEFYFVYMISELECESLGTDKLERYFSKEL